MARDWVMGPPGSVVGESGIRWGGGNGGVRAGEAQSAL